MERGHGFHATSMVTQTIAKLGLYIVEIEKKYDLNPVLNERNEYVLSEGDLKTLQKADKNAFNKYQMIQNAQEKLRQFYDIERSIEPNNVANQEKLKEGLLRVLADLRAIAYRTYGTDQSPLHSDDAIFGAEKAVRDFEWPFDADEPTRRRQITEADQLLPGKNGRVLYDPRMDQSSAAGASIFSHTQGFGEKGRDNFAFCVSLMQDFPATYREDFRKRVKTLGESKGLGFGAGPQEYAFEAEAMAIATRVFSQLSTNKSFDTVSTKFNEVMQNSRYNEDACRKNFEASKGLLQARALYYFLIKLEKTDYDQLFNDEALSSQNDKKLFSLFGYDALSQDNKKIFSEFLKPYQFSDIEKAREANEKTSRDYPAVMDLTVNSTLIEKTDALAAKYMNQSLYTLQQFLADEDLDKRDQSKKRAFTVFQILLAQTKEKFDDNNISDVKKYLAPYFSYDDVLNSRALLQAQKAYQTKYGEIYENSLKQALERAITPEQITTAMQAAQSIAEKNNDVKKLKADLKKIEPQLLVPVSGQGETLVRSSLTGYAYNVASTIFGVIEEWGQRNPIRGTAALSMLGAGWFYTAAVAAHGASIAAASHASKLIAIMTKSKIFPAFYHGVFPVHQGAGAFKKTFSGIVNGLVLGKAVFLATSLLQSGDDYTSNIANAIKNHPIESAILATSLYALGHGAIKLFGEAKAMGNWKIFDELTASIKPAAVIFEELFSLARAIKKEKNIDVLQSDEFNIRIADLMARALHSRLSAVDQTTNSVEALRQSILPVLKTLDLDLNNSTKINEAIKQVLNKKFTNNEAVKKAIELQFPEFSGTDVNTQLATIVLEKAQIEDPAVNEETYLTCLAEAQQLQALKPDLSIEAIAGAVTIAMPVSKPEKSRGERVLEAGDRSIFFGAPINAVRAISSPFGAVMRQLDKHDDASHETMRDTEKVSGYDAAAAEVEGTARAASLMPRVLANIVNTIVVAATRLFNGVRSLFQSQSSAYKSNPESTVVGAGIQAARKFTAARGEYTVKRPNDVPWYRASMTQVTLIAPTKSIRETLFDERVPGFYEMLLKNIMTEYKVRQGRLMSMSPMMLHLQQAIKAIEDDKTRGVNMALIVLKTLFPHETDVLNQKLTEAGIVDSDKRNAYLLASLQAIFRAEMVANRTAHKATYDAFAIVKRKQLIDEKDHQHLMILLMGRSDFDFVNPETSVAANARKIDQAVHDCIQSTADVSKSLTTEDAIHTAANRARFFGGGSASPRDDEIQRPPEQDVKPS